MLTIISNQVYKFYSRAEGSCETSAMYFYLYHNES
jgi:hypothetical protein